MSMFVNIHLLNNKEVIHMIMIVLFAVSSPASQW